jgi:putative hydrolase of the HAD superfamily
VTVKACLVDVYDTILNSDFEARMRAMIKLGGADPATWSAEWLRTRADRDRGKLSFAASISLALHASGIDPRPDLVADLLRFETEELTKRSRLYDDTIPFLTGVRSQGILVALVSNCGDTTRQMLEHLGVTDLADAVILSCEIGSTKPSPEIYLTGLEDLGVAAADAVMIDDQPAFCAGAEAVGVRAIRMIRGDLNGQAAGTHFPVVRSLRDVPPLL